MNRRESARRSVLRSVFARVAAACVCGAVAAPAWAAAADAGDMAPAFASPVLDTTVLVTGTFGELRSNHFHAGLDLTTFRRVGRAVLAPDAGTIRRVRASGVGYGRSLYLETDDGRLLVFGHLDAFAEPLASYVASIQDSSGQYEQDLWPEAGRFRFRAGETLGWAGQSGAGGPHLHVEVRRGDLALHPLRAGIVLDDATAPWLERLTLEPLDDTSRVEGARAARGFALERDTIRVRGWGRLRATVAARDGRADGAGSYVPWIVGLDDGGEVVECRFDSVSWATDMAESDYVFDRGRLASREAIRLWAPAGFRPVVYRTTRPVAEEAGTIRLGPGAPARALRLWATDVAGHTVSRRVWIEPEPPGPATAAAAPAVVADGARVHAWVGRTQEPVTLGLEAGCRLDVPAAALFGPDSIVLERAAAGSDAGELAAASAVFRAGPRLLPLRNAVAVQIRLAAGAAARKVALYRESGEGWEYVGAEFDSVSRVMRGSSRRLGSFALFRDARAPRLQVLAPSRAARRPYSRWALEVRVREDGSGIVARETYLTVDGRRVPSEYDPEAGVLRWKPLTPPRRGAHRVAVVAVDRAGNIARTSGSFVVD